MSEVLVKIPTQLRPATGGAAETRVEGGTVGEVLDALYARFDGLRDRVAEPTTGSAGGARGLRRFVNVYLDGEDIRFLDGLETPVGEDAEVTILPAVAGG